MLFAVKMIVCENVFIFKSLKCTRCTLIADCVLNCGLIEPLSTKNLKIKIRSHHEFNAQKVRAASNRKVDPFFSSLHETKKSKSTLNRLPLVGLVAEPFIINIGALKTIAN